MHNGHVQESLTTLAERLEAVTLRIRTLGLSRAAEDLRGVSTELRRLASTPSTTSALVSAQAEETSALGISGRRT
jgi:hypothetical protein